MTTKQALKYHEEWLIKHDKEMAAIRKLLRIGMKLLSETQKIQKENTIELKELKEMMKGRITNGHKKRAPAP